MIGMDPALKKHAEINGMALESIFSEKPEDYASMSQEQKKLINLIAQETDAKRALQRMPPGFEYQQKLAQIGLIEKMRSELERTVQE